MKYYFIFCNYVEKLFKFDDRIFLDTIKVITFKST